MVDAALIRFIKTMLPQLNKKQQRLFLGGIANISGPESMGTLAHLTGIPLETIAKGAEESKKVAAASAEAVDTDLRAAVLGIIDNVALGKTTDYLLWTQLNTHDLTDRLQLLGYNVSSDLEVEELLLDMGFLVRPPQADTDFSTLQSDAQQFEIINQKCREAQEQGLPFVYVEAKHLGKFSWELEHLKETNAFFIVEGISNWWQNVGKKLFPKANTLISVTDIDLDNESLKNAFQRGMSEISDAFNMSMTFSYIPAGIYKWQHLESSMTTSIFVDLPELPLKSLLVTVSLVNAPQEQAEEQEPTELPELPEILELLEEPEVQEETAPQELTEPPAKAKATRRTRSKKSETTTGKGKTGSSNTRSRRKV